MITSPHNARIKLARLLLGRAKERREAGAFVAEGVRLVEDALRSGWLFQYVLHVENLPPRAQQLLTALREAGVEVESVAPEIFNRLSETETPQGVLAVLSLQSRPVPANFTFGLIPDQIRDPGNLGTLLRTAAAARADVVFIPPETADPFSPKVIRAGMGAHFRLPILTVGWEEIAAHTAHTHTWLADIDGAVPCWQADLRQPLTLILGGEANGASAQARQLAKASIAIPMPGGTESLNAGAAGSILLFEVVRQRQS